MATEAVLAPIQATGDSPSLYDVTVIVRGRGVNGQKDAVQMGLRVLNQVETEASSTEASAGLEASAGWLWGKVSISGKIAHKSEQTRKTDTTAKYEVEIEATQAPIPEGLARILDMLQASIVPKKS